MSESLAVALVTFMGTAFVSIAGALGVWWRHRHRLARERAEIERERQRAIVELAAERERISSVEGPTAAAEAWAAIFKVSHETMLSLQADVARLAQRLDDQEHEHRLELEEMNRTLRARELDVQHATDSLRRWRSHMAVVTQLLSEHDISVPPPPEELVLGDLIAPERRQQTAPAVVTAIVTDNPATK